MTVEKNEPQSSQLSAMFDGELSLAECELLARRLGKDTQLKAQWSRYALIGAALRGEPTQSASRGAASRPQALQVAERVALALGNVQANNAAADKAASSGRWPQWFKRWSQPIAGTAVAAGVAALSVFWLQARVAANAELEAQAQAAREAANEVVLGGLDLPAARESLAAEPQNSAAPLVAASARQPRTAVSNGEPETYTTPVWPSNTASAASGQFASYVVAHSEYAAPLNRRNVLSALMASEVASEVLPANEATSPDAKRAKQAEAPR